MAKEDLEKYFFLKRSAKTRRYNQRETLTVSTNPVLTIICLYREFAGQSIVLTSPTRLSNGLNRKTLVPDTPIGHGANPD